MKTCKIYLIAFITFLLMQVQNQAQPFFNVTQLDNPAPGYLQFDWPQFKTFTFVDNYGHSVLQKTPSNGYQSAYFKQLSNGLWASYRGNKFHMYNNDMVLVDSVKAPSNLNLDFHDILALSNGHYLIICTEYVVMDLSESIDGGLPDANVIFNVLIETDRTGNIYWQWRAADHMSIFDVTEAVSLQGKMIDLTHMNSMFETSDGNILVSFRNYDEIAKISKSTGNFIWRMGGSKCVNNQFTFTNDNVNGFFGFSHQHTATILPNGNLLLYDNGNNKSPQYSRAVEYSINETYKTATKVWEYRYNPDIFQSAMGSVQRLPNGNTLINWGGDKITEVRPDNTITFEITYYSSNIYRAYKNVSQAITSSVNISSTGEYNFNTSGNATGVILTVSNLTGSNQTHVQRHNYPPHDFSFQDTLFSKVYPHRWVLSKDGQANISGKFRISTSAIGGLESPSKTTIYKRDKESVGKFYPLTTTYNASRAEIIADFQGFGEFVVVSNVLKTPTLSSPINGAKVILSGKLNWLLVDGAEKYQIQIDSVGNFSKPFVDVFVGKLNSYNYVGFKESSKFYWRVRAFNPKDTSDWSSISSFNTISPPPELLYPANKADGVVLSDSLKWHELSDKDVYLLQIATSNDFKKPIVNISNLAEPYFQLKTLDFNTDYFWRVLINHPTEPSDWSAIRSFKTTIANPFLNKPANQAINVGVPVAFSWSSSISADSYIIEISDSPDFQEITFSKNNGTLKYVDVSDLLFNKRYFWRVKAQKNSIISDWSEVFQFVTSMKTPVMKSPANNAVNVELTSNLTWELTELNVNYRIQISNSPEFNDLIVDEVVFSQSSFTLNQLENNRTYYWRVRALKDEFESSWSDPWMFTTSNSNKLTAPRLLYPWNYFYANVEGILMWSKPGTTHKFRLQLSEEIEFVNLNIDIYLDNDTTRWYSDLDYEKTYFWRVKAIGESDSSDWSSISRFTTMAKVYQPTLFSPTNDMLQVPVSGRLIWTYVPAIEHYNVQLSRNEEFSDLVLDNNTEREWWYDYSELQYNTVYFWRVRFKRDNDFSDWSNVWTFRTVTEDSLGRPIAVAPREFSAINPPDGVEFVWSQIPDADYYIISLSENRSFDKQLTKIQVHDTTYVFNDIQFRDYYYWRVSAVNSKTQSAWSSTRSFYTLLEIPEIVYPEDNAIGIPYDGTLVWHMNDTATFFRIQIAKDIDFNDIAFELDSIRGFSHDFKLEANQSYFMRMRSFDYFNRSEWTETINFVTDNTTNVYDVLRNNSISLTPNPASEFLRVIAPAIKNVKITDLLGNIVLQFNVGTLDEFNVDISALPAAVYFVIINENERRSMFIKRE